MIDVKSAVKSAYDYFSYVQNELGGEFEDLRLEEVELSEDEQFWLITLGYDVPVKNRSHIEEILLPPNQRKKVFKREYKIFKITTRDGKVLSMKIREI